MPLVMERVQKVKEIRLNSSDKSVREKLAFRPTEFRETNNYNSYMIIPSTTSENRKYIPMGYFGKDTISTNANLIIPNADLYYLGVLESSTHMIWTRTVAGRLETRYRYSAKIVYNNFIWPQSTDQQKQKIKQTAQAILDARALYPDSSLADLYDSTAMPIELRKAHEANDKAVIEAYGWDKNISDDEILTNLFNLYNQYTNKDK